MNKAKYFTSDMKSTNGYLLEVNDLRTHFPVRRGLWGRTAGYIKAVDGVSFRIKTGQSLGVVGESGCGKTTLAKTIIRLVPATGGGVIFEGINVLLARRKQLRRLHRDISLIFQNQSTSLNPRMTVGDIVGEPLKVHLKLKGEKLIEHIERLLRKVGLSPDCKNRFPHELSGGQRQRIDIARALAPEPKLIICDEPTASLDTSIQSQILNLMKDLQDEFGLTFLFIAHDLAVVEFFCDFVAVMYLGKIVEQTSTQQLYRNPMHPYTRALLTAIPKTASSHQSLPRNLLSQEPSMLERRRGCSFAPRCSLADARCKIHRPALREKDNCEGHFVACWKC